MIRLKATVCLVLLLGVLTGCGSSYKEGETSYGPWDAYTYTRQDNITTRRAQGTFETLNQCMTWVTEISKRTGGSYYCGFRCETKKGDVVRCERLAGYPI